MLGIKTLHKQPNSTTGVASQRLRGGPLARRRKAERRHSFCLDYKGAYIASKGGGGGAGVDTVDKDNLYDNDDNDIASVRH